AELRGLTVTRGRADFGGGVFNSGALTITSSTLTWNQATAQGGGVFNDTAARLAVVGSTVDTNLAPYGGGASNRGTLTIVTSTLTGNAAEKGGGAVYQSLGSLTIASSTLAGNSPDAGGGVPAQAGPPRLTGRI